VIAGGGNQDGSTKYLYHLRMLHLLGLVRKVNKSRPFCLFIFRARLTFYYKSLGPSNGAMSREIANEGMLWSLLYLRYFIIHTDVYSIPSVVRPITSK